jgi:hypothetical protein
VLVLGVYLADRPNAVEHLVATFAGARYCTVEQRWACLSGRPPSERVAAVTVAEPSGVEPKFALINRLAGADPAAGHDFVVVTDDDVTVLPDFIDRFIGWQQYCDFALAQPARTWSSLLDHRIVRQVPFVKARETRFVEIGPLFSIRGDLATTLMPFDESSGMGWGYDLVWPVAVKRLGLRMGIVDDAALEHRIRPRGANYDAAAAKAAMDSYLSAHERITAAEAASVLRRYW